MHLVKESVKSLDQRQRLIQAATLRVSVVTSLSFDRVFCWTAQGPRRELAGTLLDS